MKKIGFIDYYIDEWHANNYPKWIRESTKKGSFELVYAWQEQIKNDLRSLEEWCKDFNVNPTKSIEHLVEESDAIMILAPSNPEAHESLADIALRSGKPVYIDKPFSTDKASAERMFAKAEKYGTPLFSSSALRFGTEIQELLNHDLKEEFVDFVFSAGGGTSFEEYSIHQIEMLVMLMGTSAKRVIQCGTAKTNQMIIDYGSGRRATMTLMPEHDFQISVNTCDRTITLNSMTDFFPNLIDAILIFFKTKCSPVKKEETIEIINILDAGKKAMNNIDSWIKLP